MKLHRLVLRNWKGVDERETVFAPTGVTVVEGPNESGKTSLLEALDTLLTHLDDSKKQQVKAVKAVHKDVGAEVEAEIETGPYRFTYFKRFHKSPATRLVITQPTTENLSGREAHERVRQMLEQTVDLDLWSALRIEQGQGITQANLAHKKSLAAALDRAAGVARTGEDEETLHAAASAEYERYFTPASGVARKETIEAEAQVARLEHALVQDRAELAKLDNDIERSATLDRERLEARRALDASDTQAKAHAEKLREIDRLDADMKAAKAALDAATVAAAQAVTQAQDRAELIAGSKESAAAYATLAAAGDLTQPAFETARAELEAAEAAFMQASDASDEAERAHVLGQQDFEFRNDELVLAQLRERKQRIDEATKLAAQAEGILARNVVTDDALRRLQKAHLERETAKAALAVGSPELHLRALADIAPQIGVTEKHMLRGEEFTLSVAGSLTLVLPALLEIEVRTGSSIAKLSDAFMSKQAQFAAECRAAGVANLDDAVTANAAWGSARRDVEARDGKVKENLRDLTREQLDRKIDNLVPRVDGYAAARSATSAIPPDFDAAREVMQGTKVVLDAAKVVRSGAEQRRKAAQHEQGRLREERGLADLARERAKTATDINAAALKEARARSKDDDVESALGTTRKRVSEVDAVYRDVADRFADAQPEHARLRAENAADVYRRAERRMRAIEDEQIAVRARLKERGEAGLAERVDAADAKFERAKDALSRRLVHAAAAKLLFTTLDQARDEARRAYVEPLRTGIKDLGRLVYGSGFGVELNDDLQITSRTLNGRSVPFDSLSGGAKEQLGVIARIACALLVAQDGGVPVLIDDALGYSDAARLESMGALLALAGRRCQVIVLTCFPDRYRHVGGATVVRA